jgi:hypothetical protein
METERNGATTLAMFVDGWLALSKPGGNGFQSGIARHWRTHRAGVPVSRVPPLSQRREGQRGSSLGGVFRREQTEWFIPRCRENSVFAPIPERMLRRDLAVRPCLPMSLPLSSLCTATRKHTDDS